MRRPWHNRAALLAFLALALQLALPLWHMPAQAGTWLCTAQGLQQLPAGTPDQPTPAPMPHKGCPICAMALAGATGVVPQPPLLAIPVLYAVIATTPTAAVALPTLAAPPPGSRAPPAA